jgi:DNA-binding LytR/AlgR family response regulator
MRIAVCDDQHFFVDEIKNKIESYLNDKNIPFDIDTFTDGLTLIGSYKYIHKYDIIFLDVEMPCFTGEDVAKEFKNDEHRPLIIFTTSHSDFAKRGYRYNVYDFLDKSDIDNELINILNNSIKDLTTKRKEELVEFNDISVKVKNIMYLVAAKKNTEIYITTDTIKIDRTPLKYFEEQEAFKDFIKINRNTIVNYDYILSIDDNKIKMNNGVIFDVPKIKTNEIKMKIMQIGINRHGIY